MELLEESAWQWRPKATLTAADACDRCTVFALQYSDCAVLRVRWNSDLAPQDPGFAEPQVDSEPLERDLELHGHTERVVCVQIYAKDPSIITVCSASQDWCVSYFIAWEEDTCTNGMVGSVIVWHVAGKTRVTQCILVENLPAEPGWLAFDATGTLVVVASERDVNILVIERKEVLVTLEGHLARVGQLLLFR
ncbi:unnamed protein product [Phytophthora lilii]|uniref:Unnamed protein product n=1 Tax=Phytophthora lilii TaxID=2077276 RepID=A0A9W6U569_9STRA|nr:unnamed protein product [Phytophthora lilii]